MSRLSRSAARDLVARVGDGEYSLRGISVVTHARAFAWVKACIVATRIYGGDGACDEEGRDGREMHDE